MTSRSSGWLCLLVSAAALGQSTALQPLKSFPLRLDGPVLREAVQTGVPFTVAGPQGVIVGQQQGEFESWILPVKLMSHLQIEAQVDNYAVPLDITSMARQIEVRPDRTTITFSHIAMTLKMTIFAPDKAPEGTGAVVLLQLDSVSPLNLQLSFTPEMRPMWPERGFGSVSPEWMPEGKSGYYVLHTDYPEFAGAVALPGAVDGVMAPYQERPKVHPLELRLRYDPKVDGDKMYPLLMAVGETKVTATNEALHAKLLELDQQLPGIYAASAANYAKQEAERTSIQTPDTELNETLAGPRPRLSSCGRRAPKAKRRS
jgi:hypothetical protein